jgi:DNA-directed RNA polymerase subunit RPC12/RpoP
MNKVNTIECSHCRVKVLVGGGCEVVLSFKEGGICIDCLRDLNALMALRLRQLRNSGVAINPIKGVVK